MSDNQYVSRAAIFRPRSSSRLCAWCGRPSGASFVVGVQERPADPTICRSCCAQANLLWRDHDEREAAARQRISRDYVLVARLRRSKSNPSKQLPPELATSYEFLTVDGCIPSADLCEGEDPRTVEDRTAISALRLAGVLTWAGAVDPLYVGYAPDGVLSRVFVARAWAEGCDTAAGPVAWVPWPLSEGLDPGIRGFGYVLDEVWKKDMESDSVIPRLLTESPSLQFGEASVRYLATMHLQLTIPEIDVSLLPAYRQGMSEAEVTAADVLVSIWKQRREDDEEAPAAGGEAPTAAEDEAADESSGESGDDEEGEEGRVFGSTSEDEDEEGEVSSEPREGFAR